MFYTYILKNDEGKHYVGHTNSLEDRLKRHNCGQVRSTKNKGTWKIIHTESFPSKKEAYKRERQIKSFKGGKAFKKLLLEGCPSG